MPNLTKDQKALLKWMSEGHTFKVCSDYSPKKGDIIPVDKLPIRLFSGTIDKLYQAGLITFQSDLFFGLRWDEFTLTRRGKELVCTVK